MISLHRHPVTFTLDGSIHLSNVSERLLHDTVFLFFFTPIKPRQLSPQGSLGKKGEAASWPTRGPRGQESESAECEPDPRDPGLDSGPCYTSKVGSLNGLWL